MNDYVPALVGLMLFILFVGFLAVKIAAPPLLIIVACVIAMAVYDFVIELRAGADRS